jgi:hypothetical protein
MTKIGLADVNLLARQGAWLAEKGAVDGLPRGEIAPPRMIAEHRHSQRFPVCGRLTGFSLNDSWHDRSRAVYPISGTWQAWRLNSRNLAFSLGLVASAKL